MALTLPCFNGTTLMFPNANDETQRSTAAMLYWTPDYLYCQIPAVMEARLIESKRRMKICGAQYYPAITWTNDLYSGWRDAVEKRCQIFRMESQLQAAIVDPVFQDFAQAYSGVDERMSVQSFISSAIGVAMTLDSMPIRIPGWTTADIDSAVAMGVTLDPKIELLYKANLRFYSQQYNSRVLTPRLLLSIAGQNVIRAAKECSELAQVTLFSLKMSEQRRIDNWRRPIDTSMIFFETFMSVYPYYAGSRTDFYSAILALDRLLPNNGFQTHELITDLEIDAFIGLSPWGYWNNQKYGPNGTDDFSTDTFMCWLNGLRDQRYIFPCRVINRWTIDEINAKEGAMYFQERERENEGETETLEQYTNGVLGLVFQLAQGDNEMKWGILEQAAYVGMASSDGRHTE
ncbi:hypothetical protein BJ875DRAFT_518135 [Amylocarpus encephaloides]|uniref:Uncharacterized protein n=1 Tax=Amylocarpus encephaloides TaxID=45428 RepID=A0A9P8C8B6_9HELO|nr:hypothetical protein BJ875DRAFT_518135 [Amylocarpus encephaloides]